MSSVKCTHCARLRGIRYVYPGGVYLLRSLSILDMFPLTQVYILLRFLSTYEIPMRCTIPRSLSTGSAYHTWDQFEINCKIVYCLSAVYDTIWGLEGRTEGCVCCV